MNEASQIVEDSIRLLADLQGKLIWTAVILIALAALRRVAIRVIWSRTADPRLRYRWRKTTAYVLFATGVLLIGPIWLTAFRSIATFIGLLSAGIAIALRDMITNLAGWIFIAWRRPFEVGDRVQVGVFTGDVIDLGAFQFSLLEVGNWVNADQSTGRIIHVPNGRVFTEPVANFSQGLEYIWNELAVPVTFESDWRKAKRILQDLALKHGRTLSAEAEQKVITSVRRFMIYYSTLQPIVYTSVVESGVLLTMRYLCEPRRRRGSSEAIWEDILDAFAEHDDIDFAYPTRRFFDNVVEGKAGARARPLSRD